MQEQLRPGCGILPAAAPLANPYVPFQQYDPNTYGAKTGLVRGTLFPGLDLPFLGMVNRDEKPDTPMHELQALHFAIAELGLYLDTHPEDIWPPVPEGRRPERTLYLDPRPLALGI